MAIKHWQLWHLKEESFGVSGIVPILDAQQSTATETL